MSDRITDRDEIPTSKFYVTCKDTFMSGWGPARGADNILILPCDTVEEAEIVKANAENRSDQKNIEIHVSKPYLLSCKTVVYSLMNREDASRWYESGVWSK